MHRSDLKFQTPRNRWIERFRAASFACLATLLSLPANAGITIPDDPLTTGSRTTPNILFILDDSGSMTNNYMPDNVPDTTTIRIENQTYTRNTVYYNPAFTYEPWTDSTGALMVGGTDYDDVFTSSNNASGSDDLYDSTQLFYVPKDLLNKTDTYLRDAANYYRYRIHTDGKIVRSELLRNVDNSAGLSGRGCSNSDSGWQWKNCSYLLPASRNPPTVNSEAAERQNFAIWYSYHRTRMKAAKAGAGKAFSEIGKDIRVGFRTIWRRGLTGSPVTQAMPILVNRNDGLFDDPNGPAGASNNRTEWYRRLYGASGDGATPLHSALTDAGKYYQNDTANGPYGPQASSEMNLCRQNFTILTSDGYWNGKDNYSDRANEQDNTAGPTITNLAGKTYTYAPAPPYSSSDSDTLADVAMRYWKTDLRPDLDNMVPTSDADPAFWQHMTTFAISIGEKGTLDPKTDLPALTAGTLNWPTPVNNTIVNIDDLWHASINGHGDFVVASNPDEFTKGLKAALATITERTGSFSNVSANSTRIDTDTKVFQATYVSSVWTGGLSAYTQDSTTKKFTVLDWNAADPGRIPASGRKILTYTGSSGASFPTSGQTSALSRNAPSDDYKVSGADNAAYIGGARTLEGTLRNRNTLLGDIVSSSPAYVNDTDTIYVGANDGMLHAFNADNGAELFAYVPSGLDFANLSTISRPDYVHHYFVDGPVTVSTRAQTPGDRNILIGALGKGGKGIFALDVTSPGSFAAANVKWDKTGNNKIAGNGYVQDPDMGLVQGAPIIAELNNGDTAIIVSNGVNSDDNHAALFIYDLVTGVQLAKIDTGEGSAADPNGLSAPVAWDDDGDGRVDHVYAGDLHGNIWKFDLSASTPSTWTNAASRKKLFSAAYPTTPTVTRQSITSGLTVALDPKTYKTWVFFGTGSFMTNSDISNQGVQSLYGLIDNDSATLRTELQQRQMVVAGTSEDGQPVRSFEESAPLPAGKKGWFVDLLQPPSDTAEGERVVSDPQMYGSALVVASIIPVDAVCESNGRGYVNAVDAFSGTSLGSSFFDLLGDDTLTDGDGNKLPVGSVDLGVGMGTMPNLMRGLLTQGGSSGGKEDQKITDPRNTGRVSWREVIKD